jgi:hypothetical protein
VAVVSDFVQGDSKTNRNKSFPEPTAAGTADVSEAAVEVEHSSVSADTEHFTSANDPQPATEVDDAPKPPTFTLVEPEPRTSSGVLPMLVISLVTVLLMTWLIFHRELADLHVWQEYLGEPAESKLVSAVELSEGPGVPGRELAHR